MKLHRAVPLSAVLAAGLIACAPGTAPEETESEAAPRPRLAFITGGDTPFWDIAVAGAREAALSFDVELEVHMPTEAAEGQNQFLKELLSQEIDGVSISPIDPSGQLQLLNDVASLAPLVTHDSDAPKSRRLCYIGVDNYMAGRLCGRLVKEALPEGGSIAIFVGRLEQLNAQQRRQGLIDELLDRPVEEEKRVFERYFPAQRYAKSGTVEGERFTVVGTFTDDFDYTEAGRLVAAALEEHPELDGVVALFSYNAPIALRTLEELGRIGDVQIVAFDEDEATLEGIEAGEIFGTVVQNPYRYGFESIRILAGLARGDRSVLPEGGFLDVPARRITAENIVDFRAELRELTTPN